MIPTTPTTPTTLTTLTTPTTPTTLTTLTTKTIDKYIEQIIQSMTGCDEQEACTYNTIKTRCEVRVDAGVPSGDSCDQLEDEQTCENQEGCVFIFGTCTSSEF